MKLGLMRSGSGGFIEGFQLLVDSQLNFQCLNAIKRLRDRYIRIAIGSGNVVNFKSLLNSTQIVQNDLCCSRLPQQFRDVGERLETVGIGLKTMAQLASDGILPGTGGFTVPNNDNKDRLYCRIDYERLKMKSMTSLRGEDGRGMNVSGSSISSNVEIDPDIVSTQFYPQPQIPKDYKINIPIITTITDKSREHRVPSSRLSRFATFAQLGISLASGAAVEIVKRSINKRFSSVNESIESVNPFVTTSNADKIVQTLCRVRGAALKLGQMLSIQDPETVSPALLKIFERVRDSADFMPMRQVRNQLKKSLGDNWMDNFLEFDEKPFAAASIGQVHSAVLKDGRKVAMKVQYPGVAEGIDADINNLITVMKYGDFFPRGLFLENFINATSTELKLECDYEREARAMKVFRKLLADSEEFYVPEVIEDFTTKEVLTTELMEGIPLDKCENEPQEVKNYIATKFIELCLKEMFLWRFMQTDPNWSNFFFAFDPVKSKPRLILLDFGASRNYSKKFVDRYMKVLRGAYKKDKTKILEDSREIGFLSGYESKVMEDAHCDSILILGETLTSSKPFDFSKQNVTRRIHALIPVMLEHRIKAPPDEIYSLHRKLSGSFLLAAKLKATVSCGILFDQISRNYVFGDEDAFDINIDNALEDDQLEMLKKIADKKII